MTSVSELLKQQYKWPVADPTNDTKIKSKQTKTDYNHTLNQKKAKQNKKEKENKIKISKKSRECHSHKP